MTTESEFRKHPKVKQARQLLFEAELEIRQKLDEKIGSELCKCGHQRRLHGPSHSINYTGGACHYCDCVNFLHKR